MIFNKKCYRLSDVSPVTRCRTTDTSMLFFTCFFLPFLPVREKVIYLVKWLKQRTFTYSPDVVSIPSPHAPFVKCSIFKSLYSFVHSQIAYKISYFSIVQSLPPCAFLCCISAMVASRWQCHH